MLLYWLQDWNTNLSYVYGWLQMYTCKATTCTYSADINNKDSVVGYYCIIVMSYIIFLTEHLNWIKHLHFVFFLSAHIIMLSYFNCAHCIWVCMGLIRTIHSVYLILCSGALHSVRKIPERCWIMTHYHDFGFSTSCFFGCCVNVYLKCSCHAV